MELALYVAGTAAAACRLSAAVSVSSTNEIVRGASSVVWALSPSRIGVRETADGIESAAVVHKASTSARITPRATWAGVGALGILALRSGTLRDAAIAERIAGLLKRPSRLIASVT